MSATRTRKAADHSAEHEALLDAVKLALGQIPGVLVLKLTQWFGETSRGTKLRAGMRKGAMDLCVCAMGRTIWLDAKTGDAVLSPEQLQFQRLVRAHGGTAEAFSSVDSAIRIVRAVIADVEFRDPQLVARVRENHAGRLRLAELEKARAAKRASRKSRHARATRIESTVEARNG